MKSFIKKLAVLIVGAALLASCGEKLTSEDHINLADEYIQAGRLPAAVIELKNALVLDPENMQARATLGRLYFDRNAYLDAEKELLMAQSSDLDPGQVVPLLAQVLLGLAEFERLDALSLEGLDAEDRSTVLAAKALSKVYQEDVQEASRLFAAALENEPSSPYAQVSAARFLLYTGDVEESLKRVQGIIDANPRFGPAWGLLGDIERQLLNDEAAEEAYTRAIQLTRNVFEPLLSRALIRIEMKKFDEGSADLTLLQNRYAGTRRHPGAQMGWGLVHMHNKDFDEAIKALDVAARSPNLYPESLFYLASIYYEMGLEEQSLSNAYRFLGLVPENLEGTKLAAKLELNKRNYRRAETLLLPVVANNPEDPEALALLADAQLPQGKMSESLALLEKVAEMQPDSQEVRTRLGSALLAAGSEEQGIEVLRGILANDPEYEEGDVLLVMHYLRKDDVEQAIQLATKFRDRMPSATSHSLLAVALLADDDTEAAKSEYAMALELEPGDKVAAGSLAGLAMAEGDYEKAREYYQLVRDQDPEDIDIRLSIADSYAREGRKDAVLATIEEALADFPRAMQPRLAMAKYHLANSQWEQAAPYLEALTEDQKQRVDALVVLAEFELAASRFNQALNTTGKLIERNPGEAEYRYLRARAFAGLNDEQGFVDELDQTLARDPGHYPAKVAKARLALRADDVESFERIFAELKEVAPGSTEVLQLEIALAQQQGDGDRASELIQALYESDPNTANVIALAADKRTSGDVTGAASLLDGWLRDNPDDLRSREELAGIYSELGQVDGVIEQCVEILKKQPNHVPALNNLAWHLLETDPRQALTHAERAAQLAPESAPVLDTLAMAHLKNRNVAEARRSIDRAIEMSPRSPGFRLHEARIRVAEGDRQGAIATLKSLLENHPDFPERASVESLLDQLTTGRG